MNRLKILCLAGLLCLLAACAQRPYRDEPLPLEQRLALLGLRQGEAVDSILGFTSAAGSTSTPTTSRWTAASGATS